MGVGEQASVCALPAEPGICESRAVSSMFLHSTRRPCDRTKRTVNVMDRELCIVRSLLLCETPSLDTLKGSWADERSGSWAVYQSCQE